jgi:hypothetical protein
MDALRSLGPKSLRDAVARAFSVFRAPGECLNRNEQVLLNWAGMLSFGDVSLECTHAPTP